MAWALQFDGVNDYLVLTKRFEANSTDDWSLTLQLDKEPLGQLGSYYRILSTDFGVNTARIIMRTNGTDLRYNSPTESELTISGLSFDLHDKFEFRNTQANGFQLLINDSIVFTTALNRSCSLGVMGENFGTYGRFGFVYADFQNTTDPSKNVYYDSTQSDHSGGQQPKVKNILDNSGATDAQGFNFATDVSAWLDIGGVDLALEIDVPLVTSVTSQVFTPDSVLSEKLIETPLVTSSTVQVETPTVTQGTPDIEVPLITSSNSNVYSPEILSAQVIDMGLVEGVGEVFSVEIAQPITLEVNARIDAPSVVYTVYISLDGQGIFVPIENRVSWSKLSNFLRSQGFKGNNNDVIMEWLYSEGAVGEEYNDRFLSYLKGQGYNGDNLNDLRKEWSKG